MKKILACLFLLFFILMYSVVMCTEPGMCFDSTWGTAGTGNGEFAGPRDLVYDSAGNLYIADNANNRIQKFNSTNEYITQWGTSGAGDGQFVYPSGIVVDETTNTYTVIWVCDIGNNRVQKFDAIGNFLGKFGSSGSGNGQFASPNGLGIDNAGNLYVADSNNSRVQKFDNTGTYVTQWATDSYIDRLTVDYATGDVYVTQYNSLVKVAKFSSAGSPIISWGSYGTGNGQFIYPDSMAIDSINNTYTTIFILDMMRTPNNRIQKFDNVGNFIGMINSDVSGEGQFLNMIGMTIDSSGNLIIADANNSRIQKFVPCAFTPTNDYTASPTFTITQTHTETYTHTITPTSTISPTFTVSPTVTRTATAGIYIGQKVHIVATCTTSGDISITVPKAYAGNSELGYAVSNPTPTSYSAFSGYYNFPGVTNVDFYYYVTKTSVIGEFDFVQSKLLVSISGCNSSETDYGWITPDTTYSSSSLFSSELRGIAYNVTRLVIPMTTDTVFYSAIGVDLTGTGLVKVDKFVDHCVFTILDFSGNPKAGNLDYRIRR